MAVRRNFTMVLDPELANEIEKYMEMHGIEKVQQAVRSLLHEAIAATPRDGAHVAAMRRAYEEVRMLLYKNTLSHFSEMKQMLDHWLAAQQNGG